MRTQRLIALALAFLSTTASHASAQEGTTTLPAKVACDPGVRVIALRIVDSAGAGIAGAQLTLHRARTGKPLESAGPMGPAGDYLLFEDGQIADLRADGEAFEVRIRHGGRTRTVKLTIGLDAARCHVEVKRGSLLVRW